MHIRLKFAAFLGVSATCHAQQNEELPVQHPNIIFIMILMNGNYSIHSGVSYFINFYEN